MTWLRESEGFKSGFYVGIGAMSIFFAIVFYWVTNAYKDVSAR